VPLLPQEFAAMRLADLPGLLIADTVRKLRRRLIAGVVILIAAIIAVAECLSAARLALEPHVGSVGARLILAGVFLAVIAGTAYWVSRPTAAAAKDRLNSDERVTIIAEAISLGYSLARDLSKPSVADPVSEKAEPPVPPVPPTTAEPASARPL
jgi:hypothetical protein